MIDNEYIILSERYLRNNKMRPSVSIDEMIEKIDILNLKIKEIANEINWYNYSVIK